MQDDDKRSAAGAAVAEIADGMLVGLGTGSTAAHAVAAVARRVREGLRIEAVATSRETERLARAAGITVWDFASIARVDLTIDGADEIDRRLFAIKGGGGAMVREKVVAAASRRMVVIADASKLVERIGTAKLPVEVLPFALSFVAARLERLGARVERRRDPAGEVYVTDQGNAILDARLDMADDPESLARDLDATPGIVGHGLFLGEVDAAYIARDGDITILERPEGRR